MQNIKLIILFIFALSASLAFAQSNDTTIVYNKVVVDTTLNEEVLIGFCTVEGIKESPIFSNYFEIERREYVPYLDYLSDFKDSLSKIDITIVFASWCSDSQREVPRLIILLEQLEYPMDSLTILGVNRQKQVPGMDISDMYIELVPTIIFKKNKFEVGRIIELPMESLEADIAGFIFIQP